MTGRGGQLIEHSSSNQEADLIGKNAIFSDPAGFVGLVEWADRINGVGRCEEEGS
jgi:hypothetical protein